MSGPYLVLGAKTPSSSACSFCGAAEHECAVLIRGASAQICGECAELAGDFAREKMAARAAAARESGA